MFQDEIVAQAGSNKALEQASKTEPVKNFMGSSPTSKYRSDRFADLTVRLSKR